MLKFAYSSHVVMDAYDDPNKAKYNPDSEGAKLAGEQFKTTVAAAKNVIKKSADFLYVRTRAIGSLEKWGPNMNGDGFPMKELAASYQTFVGKGNFIDHKSDDITKIRGLVIDAYLNNDDQCVECLIAVDKKSHPQLARDISTGTVNSVSMGTRVGHSFCSVCNNRARTEKDYCQHISNYKGMKISFLIGNDAHRNGQWAVHERNHDLEFIELSWVAVPAFGDARVLEKIASMKTAAQNGFADPNAVSEDEKEIMAFTGHQNNIPVELESIASLAECKDEECNYDPRKATTAPNTTPVKTAAEMRRINITNDETSFRRISNDFFGRGKVALDGKDYDWWASSSDKVQWNVFFDEDLAKLISAKGHAQIIAAIEQIVSQNKPASELIVASGNTRTTTAYVQNGDEPEYFSSKIKDLEKTVASDKFPNTRLYDPKDLEPSSGNIRDVEQKTFEKSALEGPSGSLGKPLGKNDLTLNHDELKLKQDYRRAYFSYVAGKKIK